SSAPLPRPFLRARHNRLAPFLSAQLLLLRNCLARLAPTCVSGYTGGVIQRAVTRCQPIVPLTRMLGRRVSLRPSRWAAAPQRLSSRPCLMAAALGQSSAEHPIGGAAHGGGSAVQHVRVDHRRADVVVPKELLH